MELTGIFRFRKYITILFLPSQRIWEQFEQHLPEQNTLQKLEFFENATQGLVLTREFMDEK